jgi:hypothetical protein
MLNVRHSRNDEAIKTPWTLWHLGIIINEFPEIRSTGEVVVPEAKSFSIDESALWSDGEAGTIYTWEILPGDKLEMWR